LHSVKITEIRFKFRLYESDMDFPEQNSVSQIQNIVQTIERLESFSLLRSKRISEQLDSQNSLNKYVAWGAEK